MTTTLVLFWDYDTEWGAERSRMGGGPASWGPLEFPNTDRVLELLAEYDVPACFAVVGAAALPGEQPRHDADQIRRIAAADHEVASHSHRHEWLPGLGPEALRDTLALSKDAIEQCIGAPVVTFVPPFNQPFDYPRRLAISLSERRTARPLRTGLRALCETLRNTGYRFCRVGYRPLPKQLAERVLRREFHGPVHLETIAGITCVRPGGPCGFDERSMALLERSRDGVIAVYGHPHSLHSGNSQDERHLVPYLETVRRLRDDGRLEVRLPRELAG